MWKILFIFGYIAIIFTMGSLINQNMHLTRVRCWKVQPH